jgi:RNA polymerase sigma-70 factor (ECF subfamily)
MATVSILARDKIVENDSSWPELVDFVRVTMRRLVGPTRDVEDLTQIALERVAAGIDDFEGRSELTTFVYRVTANVALNHWRSWRRWLRRFDPRVDVEDELGRRPHEGDTEERLHAHRRAARVRQLLDRLDAGQRIVIVLADFEELPASRIAIILGCSEPTVRSRLRLARARLARLVLDDPFFADEVRR